MNPGNPHRNQAGVITPMVKRVSPLMFHVLLAAGAVVSFTPAASFAQSEPMTQTTEQTYQIPAGDLSNALTQFAEQSGLLLSVDGDVSKNKSTQGLQGNFSPRQGLESLLKGTGLKANFSGNSVVISDSAKSQAKAEGTLLETVTVTSATKTERPLNRITSSVEVITSEQISQTGKNSLDGVLRELSSMYVSPTGTGYSIRGGRTIDNLILINGRRIDGETSKVYELRRITASQIERIEIVKGPSSVLYGSDAIGGVINVITKKPKAGMQGNVELIGGIDNDAGSATRSIAGNISGGNETAQISAYVSANQRDPYSVDKTSKTVVKQKGKSIAPSQFKGNSGQAKNMRSIPDQYTFEENRLDKADVVNAGFAINWDATQDFTLGFNFDFMQEERRRDSESSSRNNTNFNGAPVFDIPVRQTDDNKRFDVGLEADWQVADTLNLNYQLYNSRYEKKRTNTVLNYADLGFASAEETNAAGMDIAFDTTYHELLSTWEATDSSTVLIGGEHRESESRNNQAIFAQHEWEIVPSFTAVYGARYDQVDMGEGDYNVKESKTTFKAGFVHRISEQFLWRFNYAQGFKTPEEREYFSNKLNGAGKLMLGAYVEDASVGKVPHELKPEESENFDLGIAGNLGVVNYELTAFYNEIKNKVDRVTVNDDYQSFFNVGKARIQGVESDIKSQLTQTVQLGGNLTWLDAENTDTGKQLTSSPDWMAKVYTTWNATPDMTVSGNVIYAGKQWQDADNTEQAEAYTLVNLGVHYEVIEDLDVFVNIDNLFNETNDSSLYADPGRYYKLGTNWRF